jgi:hypothetical protein
LFPLPFLVAALGLSISKIIHIGDHRIVSD